MKTIAFFDFDGTLTTKDTLVDFTLFAFGRIRFLCGLAALVPVFMLCILKQVSKDRVAQHFIHFFYKNADTRDLDKKAAAYLQQRLPKLMNPMVYQKFADHSKKGHEVVVVSASPVVWIAPWCRKNNAGLIATRLVHDGHTLTGEIDGLRCNGPQKIVQISQVYALTDYDVVFAYGNSSGDLPMLEMADHAFFYSKGVLKQLTTPFK